MIHRTLPVAALILGGVLAEPLHAPVPRDLEVGIPPGSPTEWGRRFPAITPRGPLFPKTPGRNRPPVDPTRTVATPAIAKMDVRIADSFGIVRIITWDIPGHLRWVTGRPEVPNHPITGAAGLLPLPEPGSALYWTSTAALLRLLLHPQLVSEAELIAHLVEVGEPVLGVLRAASSEPALRDPCRRIREKISDRRRLVVPLPQEPMTMRWGIALCALGLSWVGACAGSGTPVQDADSKDERPIHERIDLPSIAACGGCHQDVYRQWSSSLHHGAWSNANVQTATKRFTRETCRPCHSRATATLNLPPQLATAVTGLRFTFTALGIDGSGNLFATPPAELLVAP